MFRLQQILRHATLDMVRCYISLNEDIQKRAERRAPDLDEAKARIRMLQQNDANVRRALRSAGPRASERTIVEIEAVAGELEAAQSRLAEARPGGAPTPDRWMAGHFMYRIFGSEESPPYETARQILDRRYASGEITEERYQAMRADVDGPAKSE